MTTRDELRDQIESAIFSRRGPIEPLVQEKILPLVDAYVQERLQKQREDIAEEIVAEAQAAGVADQVAALSGKISAFGGVS